MQLKPSPIADHKYYLEGSEGQLLRRTVCTPGTRTRLLDQIIKWAKDTSPTSPKVYWLFGPAGSGKTTIAYTIARRFEFAGEKGDIIILGGNFFCSRQFEDAKRSKCIIRTIAYHLALVCKPFAHALRFDITYQNPTAQIDGLLVKPWEASRAARAADVTLPLHYLIIIDALDEIDGEGGSDLLRHLFDVLNGDQLPGLKFFATSRQDPSLVDRVKGFERKELFHLQDVGKEEVRGDIITYLKSELPHLATRAEIGKVANSADGLFIYAATVVRYLAGYEPIEQDELLARLLSVPNSGPLESSGDDSYLLDKLYFDILKDAFGNVRDQTLHARRLKALHAFVCTAEPTSETLVADLLSPSKENQSHWQAAATAIRKKLHAVLYTEGGRVLSYHKSFSDFLFSQKRSERFWCNQPVHHRLLTESCFRVMKAELRFNISNIQSSSVLDCDNPSLVSKVQTNVSAILAYCCRNWSHHLRAGDWMSADIPCGLLSEFIHHRALFWMEAMNLLGLRGQCDAMLRTARDFIMRVSFPLPRISRLLIIESLSSTRHWRTNLARPQTLQYTSAVAPLPSPLHTSISRRW